MVDLRAFALTTVAVVALSSAASAADLLPPPPQVEPPPPVVEMGGWYLRGDAGVGFNNFASASTSPSPLGGFAAGQANDNWYNSALSEAALFDLGVGYQVNHWFRADVTGELRGGSEFSGLEVLNVTGGANAGYQAADFYHGHLSTVLGMVNGYADLGTWEGITPFVGAGIGVAFNNFYGGTDNGVISQGGAAELSLRRRVRRQHEGQFRLGADGRLRHGHHPQSQAGDRLPLSQLRHVPLRLQPVPERQRRRGQLRRSQLRRRLHDSFEDAVVERRARRSALLSRHGALPPQAPLVRKY